MARSFIALAALLAACSVSSAPESTTAGFERLSPAQRSVVQSFATTASPANQAAFAQLACRVAPRLDGCATGSPKVVVGTAAPGATGVVGVSNDGSLHWAAMVGRSFIMPLDAGTGTVLFQVAPNGTWHTVTFAANAAGARKSRLPDFSQPITLGMTQGDPATGDVEVDEEPLDQLDEDDDGTSDLDDQDDDGDGVDDDLDADDDGNGVDDDAEDLDEDDDGDPDAEDEDDDNDGVEDDLDPDEDGDVDDDGVDDAEDVDDDNDGDDDDVDADDDNDGVDDEDEAEDTGSDDTGADDQP